jgi:hypothetical protein
VGIFAEPRAFPRRSGLIRLAGGALMAAIGLTACGGGSTNSAATPTPTPEPTPYVATDSGFSAVFPATPARSTQAVNQAGVNASLTLYQATTNAEQVAVAFEQLPVAPQGDAIQASLDGGVAGSAKNVNGTVASKSTTQFLGHPAEDAVIQAPGTVIRERIFFNGSKLYVLEGITSSMDAKHPAYDKLIATFKTI